MTRKHLMLLIVLVALLAFLVVMLWHGTALGPAGPGPDAEATREPGTVAMVRPEMMAALASDLSRKLGAAAPAPGNPAGAAAGTAAGDPEQRADDAHIQALLAALQKNPGDVETLLTLGYLKERGKAYSEARAAYFRATQVAPDNPEAFTRLGHADYFLGDPDAALTDYSQALAIDPGYAVALYEMGAVLRYGKHDYQGAMKTWERFLKADPNAPVAPRVRELVAESRQLLRHPETAKGAKQAPLTALGTNGAPGDTSGAPAGVNKALADQLAHDPWPDAAADAPAPHQGGATP